MQIRAAEKAPADLVFWPETQQEIRLFPHPRTQKKLKLQVPTFSFLRIFLLYPNSWLLYGQFQSASH